MKRTLVSVGVCAAVLSVGAFDVTGLQKSIDSAAAAGGGTVTVPKGDWETGPIALKSGVTLHLDKGARLLGCTNSAVYKAAGLSALIHTVGATNVAIEGEGVIDGRGGLMTTRSRPHLVNFRNCSNVRVEGVTLRCGGSWTLNPLRCDGVTIRNVKIWSHVNHCNDGIDISSSNVLIENCDVDADDDALVFKTIAPDVAVENITVRNCRLASSCNAIKFGTESHGKVRNVDIRDCRIEPTSAQGRFDWRRNTPGVTDYLVGLSGIAVECVDGGSLENVTVSGIRMDGYQTPIFVRLGARNKSRTGSPSCMKDVLIENVTATGPARSRIACSVTGVPGLRPNGVTIRNVELQFPGGGVAADFTTVIPEVAGNYPENRMFHALPLPAYAFYVRHADGVKFENVRTKFASAEERPAVVIEDAQVEIDASCRFQSPVGGAETVVKLSDSSADERMAQYWKSIDTGDAYFMKARCAEVVKQPLVVFLGATKSKPPSAVLAECRSRGWSMLAPFAKDVEGVLSSIARVEGFACAVFLKGDGPFATLALKVLAAAPSKFSAVSVISPEECPAGLDKVQGVDVDIVVAARHPKASAGFAAYNALCAKGDQVPCEVAKVTMRDGKAPAAFRFPGNDPDFAPKVRPLALRRESGAVRLSVTSTRLVACVSPSFKRFSDRSLKSAEPPVRLILAGDSTMQRRSSKNKAGSWGEKLSAYLRDDVEIVNCARGGRSTRTFWPDWNTNVVSRIRPGDWVFIQFGHNDMSKASDPKIDRQTDPDTEYSNNLRRFVADVRLKGGNPVLVTSITLYLYDKKDRKWTGKNPLARWAASMKRLAEESQTPLIDLNAETFAAVRDAGADKAAEWYMISVDGKDRAHPTKAGAKHFAELFMRLVREANSPVSELFRTDGK